MIKDYQNDISEVHYAADNIQLVLPIQYTSKSWRRNYMTEKEQVQQIVKKYNKSIADLSENASAKEFKTVMNYVADEANRKQRKLVGLDK